nr:orotate phosphoribosyltransferase [Luminiphilus syltensis]
MDDARARFITLAVACDVLKFGEFELKSGRISPYFFNAGAFNTGEALATLGECYAAALLAAEVAPDMLFGPAYKGIPLVATTAVALAKQGTNLPFAFNRKEAKAHGEGGTVVGAPLRGRVVIVDDVITAGTAIRESVAMIKSAGAEPAAVIIGLDRAERGQGDKSAVQEATEELGLAVTSVIDLHHIIRWLEDTGADRAHLESMQRYRDQYGA